jgi:long-chain acyl-CoA synthetase
MPRETLLDFFADLGAARGDFLVYDDGYRARSHSYADVVAAARAFAARLQQAGIVKGDHVVFWSENRPEWIVAFWGTILAGAIAVPVDYRASAAFLTRVRERIGARLLLVGAEVEEPATPEGVAVWPLSQLDWSSTAQPQPIAVTKDDVAEVIFTSGATAEPKGVIITHRNLLANVVPVEREVAKYRKYGKPFFPLRFLNLLPLSHLFGQAMATFIPPLLPGTVVFIRGYNPHDIVRQIKKRRVSVLVSVPKILDVLRDHVSRSVPDLRERMAVPVARESGGSTLRAVRNAFAKWWRYADVHRMFGWKFWAFVVGAAPLEPASEEFWATLGCVVIQGYGLTETAPIVSLNHPFHTSKGSVGKAIAGVDIKLAADGEILVRGDNVTRGYVGGGEADQAFDADGWFHTGDVGELDREGQLFIRGRKKEMIVTPEGLNVFPEDVERALNVVPGVRDSAVVGITNSGQERVHAVLVVDDSGIDAQDVVRRVNATLEDHQKIRGVSVWPARELPRTEGTRKLKRKEIQRWVQSGATARPEAAKTGHGLDAILAKYGRDHRLSANTTIDELGLSSLERVELMVELEDRMETSIDESAFASARTIGDLQKLVERAPDAATVVEPVDFPEWNRRESVRVVRSVSLATWILPLARIFAWLTVEGREHVKALTGPVVFAANHQSHMDVPVILSAMPARYRYRTAPAMAKEFFKAHFFPEGFTRRQRFTNGLNYYLAAFFFNAFPLPQREAGARQTLRYVGELISDNYSVLIFPEGSRTEHGEIKPFRPGIGMIGSKLKVPIVPVRLVGVDKVLHPKWKMARPGRVQVKFGRPIHLEGEDYQALAKRIEDAVQSL